VRLDRRRRASLLRQQVAAKPSARNRFVRLLARSLACTHVSCCKSFAVGTQHVQIKCTCCPARHADVGHVRSQHLHTAAYSCWLGRLQSWTPEEATGPS
jgi:hypothetical protein